MIKMVYCIRKKCEMSSEEFLYHWREVHGPLGSRVPGVKRYVQNYVVLDEGRIMQSFDGIVELWFESLDALLLAKRSVEWKTLLEDQRNFADHDNELYFLCEEYEVGTKLLS